MGFLDDLKSTAKTEFDAAKKAVRTEKLKAELNDLKRLEQEAFANLGRAAADTYGLESFGEHGKKSLTSERESQQKKLKSKNQKQRLSN